jgi:hypothetical protein
MKKSILLCVLGLAIIFVNTNAQTYSTNKLKYDSRLYVPEFGDIYSPVLSGVCSFLMPGLGQIISGETGRGLAFLGGTTGCLLVGCVGYGLTISSIYSRGGSGNSIGPAIGLMIVGFSAMTGVYIWSIVDAVDVAKVNNMCIRDLRKTSSIKLELAPYVAQISINNQLTTPLGFSMRVSF